MNPRNKVTPAHGSPRPTFNGAHKPAAVQPKSAGARQVKPPTAPPVYRPQPVPKVLQTKMKVAVANHQPVNQSGGARPVPAAPPVYRPQPVPKVLQAKQTKASESRPGAPMNRTPAVSFNGDARFKRCPTTPVFHGAAIQRAENTNYGKTTVKATSGTFSATGHSGNAGATMNLLNTMTNTDGGRLKYILDKKVESKLIDGAKGGKMLRTSYDCAEPNAVAKLLAMNASIKLEDIKVSTAYDSGGFKAECPVCSQWIDGGEIIAPTNMEYLCYVSFGDTSSTQAPQQTTSNQPPKKVPELNDTNFPSLGGGKK